jgi:hypothetical protein
VINVGEIAIDESDTIKRIPSNHAEVAVTFSFQAPLIHPRLPPTIANPNSFIRFPIRGWPSISHLAIDKMFEA